MNTKSVCVGIGTLLWLGACAASEEVDDETLEIANGLVAEQRSGGESPSTSTPSSPATPGNGSNSPTTNPGTVPPVTTPNVEPPVGGSTDGGVGGAAGGVGGAAGGMGSIGGSGGGQVAGGAGGSGPITPTGGAPASMDWATCDPAWAAHFCPELDCETTDLCSDGSAQYETDCRLWCKNLVGCAATNNTCIEANDPLCIGSYSPRSECVDYIDSQNPKSAGTQGQNNYDGSWGSKAAKALVECACGG